MFEKEAFDYGMIYAKTTLLNTNGELEQAFKDGAEFGYNKANEWHYPSNGEYPKVETWVVGVYYGKDNWHKIFYRADGKWWG